jgi:gentisate 1,2-dioxygenase
MSMSLQLLMPGEVARPHRHTTVAFRFFLEGSAYTTVNGEKCVMGRGDLVLTPYMQWHDHGNESSAPAIWIDGLDFPLVRFLDAIVKQDSDVAMQTTDRSGHSDRRFSSPGLRPAWVEPEEAARSSLLHYRWANTESALQRLAAAGDASPTDDVIVEYVNPATGQSVFTTIGCYAQMIRPNVTTRKHRHTGHNIFHVLEGSGVTVVNDKPISWSKGDIFVVPSLHWHHHENNSGTAATLFRLTDAPTMKRLDLWWEEVEGGNRPHVS